MQIRNRKILCSLPDPKEYEKAKREINRLNVVMGRHMLGIGSLKLESPTTPENRKKLEEHKAGVKETEKQIQEHNKVLKAFQKGST